MAYRKKKYVKKTKKYAKKRSYPKKGGRSSIKVAIRREIARNTENKTKQTYQLGLALASSSNASWNTTNIVPVYPSATALDILQGTGNGARIGNRIKIKKLRFKGTMTPLPQNGTSNVDPKPVQVKMVLFYDKTEPTDSPAPQTDFYQFNSTSTSVANDLIDMWAPFNTDKYAIMAARTFKLGFQNYNTAASNITQTQTVAFPNNDFKLNCNFSFDLTPHVIKNVKYNDNNATPTNRGLYCAWLIANADGSAIVAASFPVGVQYMLDCVYEDA